MQTDQSRIAAEKTKESINNKEYYQTSLLKFNALSELCNDISNTESLDVNVEKFLVEMADNYVESIIDTACQIAKHKKSEFITVGDLSIATDKNFEIFEPSRSTQNFGRLKSNEIRNVSTIDHKKRVELTREECKNIN